MGRYFLISLLLISFHGYCQSNWKQPKAPVYDISNNSVTVFSSDTIEQNDTDYTRIVNGILVSSTAHVHEPGSYTRYITDKNQIKQTGINTTKPLLFINGEKYDIQYKVDSVMYNYVNFYDTLKFPYFKGIWSLVELPIAVNGELLTPEKRRMVLPKLKVRSIKVFKYIDRPDAAKQYPNAPFGIIDLELYNGKQ
jgi:hypothetical protein